MALAKTVEDYLGDLNVSYDLLPHTRTATSIRTASAAHVPAHQIAKGVMLEDDAGYVMAVLPADRRVHLGALREQLGRRMGLATEQELGTMFQDCTLGAVPPVGEAYGIETVVDDELSEGGDVYFEAGDHEELVHLPREAFLLLHGQARRGHFSKN